MTTAVLERPKTTAVKQQQTIQVVRPWLGLSVVLMATLMNLLDSSVVNVAAPAILRELGGSFASLQWISAGYTLALAVGLLTGGRLGDMFGRKRMLMMGGAGFTIASLACAIAWSPETLIAARVAQGLFAAVMVPQCFGLIRDLFSPQDMAKAFGIFGPAIGLATILGPVISGLLTEAAGWRSIFLINLPLGAYVLIMGRKALPSRKPVSASKSLDVAGMLMAGAGMFLLVYPLVQGREIGWPAWTLAMLAASIPVLAGFGIYQLRRAASGRIPLVRLTMFAKRSYSSGVVFVIVFFGAIVGFSLAIGVFLQLGLGYSAMKASLTMAGWAIGAFAGSAVSAMTMAKLGRRVLHNGLAIMGVGVAIFLTVVLTAGTSVSGWLLALPLLVYGFGMGQIFVPLFDIIMGDVSDSEVGSASSSLEALQQLGASLGVAILGTVFFGASGLEGVSTGNPMDAVALVTAIALGLTVVTFALGFLLPKKARAAH
jgi:EmrB/QacA subfamily drug resistance transporter